MENKVYTSNPSVRKSMLNEMAKNYPEYKHTTQSCIGLLILAALLPLVVVLNFYPKNIELFIPLIIFIAVSLLIVWVSVSILKSRTMLSFPYGHRKNGKR